MSNEAKQTNGLAPRVPVWRRLAPLAVLAAAIAGFFALGLDEYFSFAALRENYGGLRAWIDENRILALLVFMGVYASAVAISFPGASILTITAGILFGWIEGTIAVVLAATLGATVIFLVARTALGEFLRARASGFVTKVQDGFNKDPFWYLMSLRLIPLVPFWALNIVAGVLNMRLAPYVVATFFGIIPATAVFVSIGNGARAAFEQGGEVPALSLLGNPEIFLPFVGLGLLSLLPVIVRRLRRAGV